MATHVFISFDLETTGLRVQEDDITEIGAAVFLLDEKSNIHTTPNTFCQRVRADKAMSVAAQRITKITDEQLANEQPFPVVLDQFTAFISNSCNAYPRSVLRALVAFNGNAFDMLLLIHVMRRHNIDPIKYFQRWRISFILDVMVLCRVPGIIDSTTLPRANTGRAIYRLEKIYQSVLQKPLVGAHGALQDCVGVIELIMGCESLQSLIIKDLQLKTPQFAINFPDFITNYIDVINRDKRKDKKVDKRIRTIDSFYSVDTHKLAAQRTTDTVTPSSSSSSSSSSPCCELSNSASVESS